MKNIKGIIMAGGTGSRLFPVTKVISKQLIPLYDKPMIYYPLSVLKKNGIKEVLIISDRYNIKFIKKLLGKGKNLKMNLSYKSQIKPNGIPEGIKIGKKFLKKSNVLLMLGDNIIYNKKNINFTKIAMKNLEKGFSTIFGYRVKDPERYGVVTIDKKYNIKSIIEKPKKTNSNIAVIGLYFFTNDVLEKVKNIRPSIRGELEIVDLIKQYLISKKLKLNMLNRKFKWFDTGTFDSILEASRYISYSQKRKIL